MIKTKAKIIGFLMTTVLALSAPLVYADNGNGGNVSGGQPAAYNDQSSSRQGDHEWGNGHWGKHGDHKGGRFFHKLNLTDEQKKQLNDIWQKQKEAKKVAIEQIKANKEALTNELLQTTPDMNKINDLKSKLEAVGAQMLDSRINSDLEVKKILTAEQFAKYLEFQKHKFFRHFYKGDSDRGGCRQGHCGFGGHSRHHDRNGNSRSHWGGNGDDNN